MDRDYFEGIYADGPDPWGFETSEYERRKYDLTLAALPRRRYARALEPGCSIGVHEHTGEAEMFYFASGEGTVTDDGVKIAVKAGDSMTTPSGHTHGVENTGSEDLVIIAAIARD